MTASKSSRARQARAQRAAASAAANARAAGRASGSTAVKAPVKDSGPVKASAPVKAGAGAQAGAPGKAGATVTAGAVVKAGSPSRAVAARGGAADRRGSRGPALAQEAVAEAPGAATAPPWFQFVTWGLSLAGLGVSIYLTIAHFTDKPLVGCAEGSAINCTKVTTSPQSYVFGIPVAVLGLAFFVAAVALMSPWAWRRARREVALLRIASLVVGIGFVLYLLYAELFMIRAICLYCTSVHVISFLLFVLTAFAAAAWGLPERQRG
jgi:uncharacterized membrane protein